MGCKESEEVMVGYGVTTLMRFLDDLRDELLLIESFEMSKVLQHDCLNRSGPSEHHGDPSLVLWSRSVACAATGASVDGSRHELRAENWKVLGGASCGKQ